MTVLRQPVWTTPITWTDAQPLDEDTLNEQLRNNQLFLKQGHLSIRTNMPSGDYTTTSSSFALVNSSVVASLTIETPANMYVSLHVPYEHSVATAAIYFDLFDGAVYLSSGTGTPLAEGLGLCRAVVANRGRIFSRMLHIGLKDPGTYSWKLYWATSAATAKIPYSEHPIQIALWAH